MKHLANFRTVAALVALSALLPSASTQAATLGVNTLTCLRPSGVFGNNDDHAYLMVSVSKSDGTSQGYRLPGPMQYWPANATFGRSFLPAVTLWSEPMFPGERVLVAVSLMDDHGAGPYVMQQQADGIARMGAQVLASGTPDRTFYARFAAQFADHTGSDNLTGQFVAEITMNAMGVVEATFFPTASAHGANSGPLLGDFKIDGNHSDYRVSVGVNPN